MAQLKLRTPRCACSSLTGLKGQEIVKLNLFLQGLPKAFGLGWPESRRLMYNYTAGTDL